MGWIALNELVTRLIRTGLIAMVVLCGCRGEEPSVRPTPETDSGDGSMTLIVNSDAFTADQPIPERYTGDGEDSSPSLRWSGAPAETKQFALICDDPDAPRPDPWVHWVLYGIPADVTELPEGLPRTPTLGPPVKAMQGANSWPSDNIGYRGPAPPSGHGTHHYHFKVHAIDIALDAEPGLDKATLLQRIAGHVLAEGELVGTYERQNAGHRDRRVARHQHLGNVTAHQDQASENTPVSDSVGALCRRFTGNLRPDVALIVIKWHILPVPIQAGILAMVRSAALQK